MNSEINAPNVSKINWTAVVIQLIGILVISGIIPEEYSDAFIALATLLLPTLIQVFRTWYTERKV